MKTFQVIGADVITPKAVAGATNEPFVGLTVTINGKTERIARTCKQALLDLHKSARASRIPEGLFNNGYNSANPVLRRQFVNEVIALVGKVGIGDVEVYKAGDTYIATADSSRVKAGQANVGDTLLAEKDGTRVEGFLSFPLTDSELMRRDLVADMGANLALMFAGSMGLASTTIEPVVVEQPKVEATGFEGFTSPEHEAGKEAFGHTPTSEPEVESANESTNESQEELANAPATVTAKRNTTK